MPEDPDDSTRPAVNRCVQCGVGIGNATGLCASCAQLEAGEASRNGDDS